MASRRQVTRAAPAPATSAAAELLRPPAVQLGHERQSLKAGRVLRQQLSSLQQIAHLGEPFAPAGADVGPLARPDPQLRLVLR